MDIKQESGRRIREARDRKKLKLREVCEQIEGLGETRLSNYENGDRRVPVEMAKRLAYQQAAQIIVLLLTLLR